MARAAAEGHQVHVVFATGGEHGEVPDDLAPDETLADRRHGEAHESARIGGVRGVHWLGYTDSGMTGWAQNDEPDCFARADLDEAAVRLVGILRDVDAAVVVGYDWHGNYGHPDHIKVHQVVRRAVQLCAPPPRLFEASMNRDLMRGLHQAALAAGVEGFDPDAAMDDGNPMGTPEAELQLRVDVSDFLSVRRRMIAAHASQVTDVQGLLSIPEEAFATMFGHEHFIEVGSDTALRDGWFF